MSLVKLGVGYYPDPTRGRPVFNGSIYVGVPDTDPEIPANQLDISVRQENGTVVPVSQPVQTGAGGVPMYNGSPAQIVVDGNYSLKVLNNQGSQVYYSASATEDVNTGVTPLLQPRQTGDGVQSRFNTPATSATEAESLQIYRDGVKQRPYTDYTTDTAPVGKVDFATPPPDGASIDITFYRPNLFEGLVVDFLDLSDTPDDYTGQGSKTLKVKADASGVEFADGDFLELSDTPSSYVGQSGQTLVVKGTEDGLEFGTTGAVGRSIDTAQTGDLAAATTWVIDTNSVRTRNLPASPADGDEIGFVDEKGLAATNNFTIGRNGKTIANAASDLVGNVNFGIGVLKYNAADGDWKLVP